MLMSFIRSPQRLPHLLALLIAGSGLTTAPARGQAPIVIPGLESARVSEAWVEGDLMLLRTEAGGLYSVPVAAVDLEAFQEVGESPAPPSLADIIELLQAGVSERTVRAYIEASARPRYEISKKTLIELKQAGASEDFIQYLTRLGRPGPRRTYITWSSPHRPSRDEEPSAETPVSTEGPRQEGIPFFPYVFPGFGVYYPYYPVYPSHPIYPGAGPGDSTRPPDGPGYYWPMTRSLSGRTHRPHHGTGAGKPRPEPYPSRTQLWLRWKGPMRGGDAAEASGSINASPRLTVPTSYRSAPVAPVTSSGRGSHTVGARRPAVGSSRHIGARSISGATATRSSSSRSLTGKRN